MSSPIKPLVVTPAVGGKGPFGDMYPPVTSLGTLLAYARVHNGGVLQQKLDIPKLIVVRQTELDQYYESLKSITQPVILLVSAFVWNVEECLEIARRVKALDVNSFILCGGPEIPRFKGDDAKFLEKHDYIDASCRGEGEVTCAETLETLMNIPSDQWAFTDLSHIKGLSWKKRSPEKNVEYIRNPDREREKNLDRFPSPILTGELDEIPRTISLGYETNRGCPFGCTFCDWGGATLSKIYQFDLQRALDEIEWMGKNNVMMMQVADSNFGAFDRDIEIAQKLADTKAKYGFPTGIGASFAKNGHPRLVTINSILYKAGLITVGQISFQAVDQHTLDVIDRKNISGDRYDNLLTLAREADLPMANELMVGLPGQTRTSYKNDLQFFFDRKVSIHTYATSVMPNAPMNDPDYKAKYEIITGDRNIVTSTASSDEQQIIKTTQLYLLYQLFIKLSLMRYTLYYLQMEHGLKALDLMDQWLDMADNPANAERFPISRQILTNLLRVDEHRRDFLLLEWKPGQADFLFMNLDAFYDEVYSFCEEQFNVVVPEFDKSQLKKAQAAVMPRTGKHYPNKVELDVNILEYFKQIKEPINVNKLEKPFQPLTSYKEKFTFCIPEQENKRNKLGFTKSSIHGDGWELKTDLRFY